VFWWGGGGGGVFFGGVVGLDGGSLHAVEGGEGRGVVTHDLDSCGKEKKRGKAGGNEEEKEEGKRAIGGRYIALRGEGSERHGERGKKGGV